MRKCRNCKKELPPVKLSDNWQRNGFCVLDCMAKYGLQKAKEQRRKKEKAAQKEAKVKLRTRKDWVNIAQRLLNQIVVLEDKPKGCISCDTGNPVTDSGHYFHRGNKYRVSPLTLLRLNLNGQCEACNRWEGGKTHDYMVGFIDRYGQAKFDELTEFRRKVDCGEIPPLTIDECKELIEQYKERLKALKA